MLICVHTCQEDIQEDTNQRRSEHRYTHSSGFECEYNIFGVEFRHREWLISVECVCEAYTYFKLCLSTYIRKCIVR